MNPFCQPIGIRNSTNFTDFELRSQEIDKKLEEEKGGKTVGCEYVVIGMLPINIRAARLLPQITQNHFFRTWKKFQTWIHGNCDGKFNIVRKGVIRG